MTHKSMHIVIIKPSKYDINGHVERFRRGFMPNSTVPYLRSMTPESVDGVRVETHAIDEYVQTDLRYLNLLRDTGQPTLLALAGVQSHQFQRALDLCAFAKANGVRHCVIGGPHPMTCDTSALQGRGVSFALAEAEQVWFQIIRDATTGELQPAYGMDRRWATELQAPVLNPPSKRDMYRYFVPMLGIYPARGCPFTCNFCSVIKIAGHQIRSQSVDTTIESLRRAKAAGVWLVMFTSDNFNKYAEASQLMERMIEEDVRIPFFAQCDTQISKQEDFVELMGRAGCFEMFVGVESFSRKTLLAAHKTQNYPSTYSEIVRLCRKYGIVSHFSNMIGFPEDTAKSVREHLDILRGLRPDIASFYILCPVPGTEQYDDFLAAGRITERNLDRFDATTTTWEHPNLSSDELEDLLFFCYRGFYSAKHLIGGTIHTLSSSRVLNRFLYLGQPYFNRVVAQKRMHPMSGGISRVRRDSFSDYRDLRKKQYGIEYVPLPKSLALSKADAELNRKAKVSV